MHDGHDPVLELGRRDHLRGGERKRVGHALELFELAPARSAAGQVRDEALALVVGQPAQDVAADVVQARAGHVAPAPASSERIFFSPRRMRPLIVPTGVLSIDAISVCVNPPK